MKDCNKKVKNTCWTKSYAPCIYYELEIPDFSTIEEECVSLEDTTKDVYILIEKIREQLDLSELGEDCISYDLDEDGKLIVKNVLLELESKYCELEDRVKTLETTAICDMPLGECVDLGTLVDTCDVVPTTFGQLLQILIEKHQE